MKTTHGVRSRWVTNPITGKRERYLDGAELPPSASFRATPKILGEIVNLYMQGQSIKAISQVAGMPKAAVIYHWIQQSASFRNRMKEARAMRGLHFEEKAIEAAEGAVDKDDAPAARLRYDAYKWAAEVSDGLTYGKKTTVQGNPDQPIQFVISTGFPEPNKYQTPPKLGSDGLIKKDPK